MIRVLILTIVVAVLLLAISIILVAWGVRKYRSKKEIRRQLAKARQITSIDVDAEALISKENEASPKN